MTILYLIFAYIQLFTIVERQKESSSHLMVYPSRNSRGRSRLPVRSPEFNLGRPHGPPGTMSFSQHVLPPREN